MEADKANGAQEILDLSELGLSSGTAGAVEMAGAIGTIQAAVNKQVS